MLLKQVFIETIGRGPISFMKGSFFKKQKMKKMTHGSTRKHRK